MTCTAVSYPQANPDTDYIIQHPFGITLTHTLTTPGEGGVIHEIGSAMDSDNGTYTCHVIIIRMDTSMTGAIEEDLIVIDINGTGKCISIINLLAKKPPIVS